MSDERNLKLRNFRETDQPSDSKRGWKRSNDFLTPSPHRPRGNKDRRSSYQQRSPKPRREPPQKRPHTDDLGQFPELPKKENVPEPGILGKKRDAFTPEVNTVWNKPATVSSIEEVVDEDISPRFRRKLDLGSGKKEGRVKENEHPEGFHFLMMQEEYREKARAEGKEVMPKVTEDLLKKREKDIEKGYQTESYRKYLSTIQKTCRSDSHPNTPDKHRPCSRRSWDMQVRIWRKNLHHFDTPVKRTEISWKNANFNRSEKDKSIKAKKEERQRVGDGLMEEDKNSIEASDLEDLDMELDVDTSVISVCSEAEGVAKTEDINDQEAARTEDANDQEAARTEDANDQEVPGTSKVGNQDVDKIGDVNQEEKSNSILASACPPSPPVTPPPGSRNSLGFLVVTDANSKPPCSPVAGSQPPSPSPRAFQASTPNPPRFSKLRRHSCLGMTEMPSTDEEEDEDGLISVDIKWTKGLETPESSPSISPVSGGTGNFSFRTAEADSPLLDSRSSGSPHGSDGFGPSLGVEPLPEDAPTGAEVEGALKQLNISREEEPGATEPCEEEMDVVNESVSSWYTAELDEEVDPEDISSWCTLQL